MPDVGKYPDGRVDDFRKMLHFSGKRYAGFKNSQVMPACHLPDRKGNANLGVVTLGAANDPVIAAQHLKEPLLDDGFAVTSSDADHWDIELRAVKRAKRLEGGKSVGYEDKRGGMRNTGCGIRDAGYQECSHSLLIKPGDILMPVVAIRNQSHKHGVFGMDKQAAVDQKIMDNRIVAGNGMDGSTTDGSNFRDRAGLSGHDRLLSG